MMYSVYDSTDISLLSLAAVQAAVIVAALLLSALLVHFKRKNVSLTRLAMIVLYVCFAALTAAALTSFALFLGSFTHLSIRFFAYLAALLLLSAVAARKGLAVIMRCSVVIFFVNMSLDILGGVMLASRFSPDLLPDSADAVKGLSSVAGIAVSELAVLLVLFLFSDELPERLAKPLFAWSVILPLFSGVMCVLSLGALGDYSKLVRFPMYSAMQTIGFGTFQRLDVIFLCSRASGMFIVLSLLLCALDRSGERAFGRTAFPLGIAFIGAIVFLAAEYRRIGAAVMMPAVRIAAVLLCVFVLLLSLPKKRLAKGAALTLALVLPLLFMSGCDKVQIQDRMLIKAIGIDYSDGVYALTVQYADNSSSGEEQINKLLSVAGNSTSQAIGKIKDSSGSEPFLGQTSALVIGKSAAEKSLDEILDYFVSYSEVRPTVRLYLCENAKDILSFKEDDKLVAVDRITSITPSSSNSDNRFTMMSTVNLMMSQTDTVTAAFIGIKDGAIRLLSAAYIDENKLHMLGDDEYTAYCLLNGLKSETVLTKGGVSCEVTSCKTKVRTETSEGKLLLYVTCEPQLSVLENTNETSGSEIERLFSESVEKNTAASIGEIVCTRGCDIFGFGHSVSGEIIAGKDDLRRLLKGCEVHMTVNCRVVEEKALR